jgi:DNA-binding winged helix-turn-helix (wHTH) protein
VDMRAAGVLQITDAEQAGKERARTSVAGNIAALQIDGWLMEPALNRLTREGVSIRLRPQLVDLLLCLASRPGKVFPKDELVARVWEGRWIAPSGLSRCIAELRTALADSAHAPHIIETIPKRGYRLIAAVAPVGGADGTPARTQPVRVDADGPPEPPGAGWQAAPRVSWRWWERMARRFTGAVGPCA